MKKSLIVTALAGCAAGFALRLAQRANSFDADGLIARGDGLTAALTIVCLAVLAFAVVVCLRSPKGSIAAPDGKKTPARGVLEILSGVALLGAYLPPTLDGAVIDYVMLALAFAAGCAMAVEGAFHLQGREGSLLGGCIVPVYLAVLLVRNYRLWSINPVVSQYAFQLLFLVLAMVVCFELAAFRVGRGKQRLTACLSVFAVCVAGPALADGGVRNVLHIAALAVYLAAEFLPYFAAKPIPAAKAETPEESEPELTAEEIIEEFTVEEISDEFDEISDPMEKEAEELTEDAAFVEEALSEPEELPEQEELPEPEAFAGEAAEDLTEE